MIPARASVSATAVGRQRQVDAERAEHVGRARGRARGPVAVLDDGNTGCRGHDGRHGRDVDGAEPVASGADDVEHGRVDGKRQRGLEDRIAEAHDLVDGLALRAQRDEESGRAATGVAEPDITCRIAQVDSDTLRSRRSSSVVRISGQV